MKSYEVDLHKVSYLIGYGSGMGAHDHRCYQGSEVLKNSHWLSRLRATWMGTLFPKEVAFYQDALPFIAELCQRLSQVIAQFVKEHRSFSLLGGDHSSAIGTWHGVSVGLNGRPFGLIWIDAHMDANTPETSPSQCIHGMPLACLLGYGNSDLVYLGKQRKPVLQPHQVVLVGVRSYEKKEEALLKRLGVLFYTMEDIQNQGLAVIMEKAVAHIQKRTCAYGISLDIDAVDPSEAPGTGCCELGGISAKDLSQALAKYASSSACIGLEVAEFNPALDQEKRTEKLIIELLQAAGF